MLKNVTPRHSLLVLTVDLVKHCGPLHVIDGCLMFYDDEDDNIIMMTRMFSLADYVI